MLHLPDVSLVVCETLNHELARLAIDDCVKHADFGDILIFSDKDFKYPGSRWVESKDWANIDELSHHLWYGIHPHINTSHMFLVHWDSWIIDPTMWRKEFLEYDWVGAPWWYDERNVGCGAFCLRSKRLMQYISEHKDEYPDYKRDDDIICRTYRPSLESQGFKWPTTELAYDLAFECVRPSLSSKHFGFHKMMNWPLVMHPKDLVERVKIASQSSYLKRTGQLRGLLNVAPWLQSIIGG